MTTPKSLATQLRNLLSLLLEADVAILINPIVEQHIGSELRITWRSPTFGSAAISKASFATVDEYSSLVSAQMYSAVLFDGSLLQISYDFAGHEIVGHRLCYYPCPFDIEERLLREEPLSDVIELYRESNKSLLNLRSPCRFDFDEKNASAMHPSVHLHIIKAQCRWPISHPISIGEFVDFVFRHFYPQIWLIHPFLRKWPREDIGPKKISRLEELEMHVACGQKVIASH